MHIWVIDTSSILAIRREAELSDVQSAAVYTELSDWVHRGAIVFPPQVMAELGRFTENIRRKRGSDPPFAWAKSNESKATRHGHMHDGAKVVLQRVPELIDPDKVSIGGVDDADPYIVALARELVAQHHSVTIITEDFNTTPAKVALADAAGLFGIPTVRVRTFLKDQEIWPE